ncbi:MAG: histidine kinase [Chitinophagaceae bacterium]|nr:histidine kinase [Chitinophagaceae bacterium]
MGGQWYTKKWVAVSLHMLFWTLFFVSPYLLRPVMDDNAPKSIRRFDSGFIYLHFLNNVLRMTLFYINAYLFIPKLVYRKKYTQYLLLLLLFLAFMLVWDRFFFNLLIDYGEHKVWNFFVFNLFPFFFIVIASTAFRVIRDRIKENQRIKERETENLKTELSFLRSQVSPHFMFNVLNNMVALARKKSDALEPSLIKLSSLLRYMLYETDEDKVPLNKEVEYLQSYIDLQQQRFGKNVKINTCFENIENGYTIEPMLLIPFVENAFKHGTGIIADAQIDIKLIVQNGVLQFLVRNRYNDAMNETKDKTSGIGLSNVKRRLNLLYDKRHSLQIDKKDGWFTVSLQLNLH